MKRMARTQKMNAVGTLPRIAHDQQLLTRNCCSRIISMFAATRDARACRSHDDATANANRPARLVRQSAFPRAQTCATGFVTD